MDFDLLVSLIIIFALILLNGFFSGAEIAIISLRKSRTKALRDEGNKRARLISRLQNNPDNFFATVQIGVTLVGVFNGVFAGSSLALKFSPLLEDIPYIGPFSAQISMFILVVAITYLSLVFGELVPKSLALHNAERFALFVAYPLHIFSIIFQAFTKLLTFTSNLILKPFKDKTSFSETRLSPEEILHMVEEGVRAGTIEESEHELIENILEINETAAREVMVPRVDIQAISADAGLDEYRELINSSFFSRIPVFQDNLDNILGILHLKDLMRVMARGADKIYTTDLVRPAVYVPETMKIGKILKDMQKRKIHMAIVVDEYGGTAGLLTMEDILEEIVGEIEEIKDDPDERKIIPQPDSSYLVVGSCSVIDFNEYFAASNGGAQTEAVQESPIALPESDAYTSVAGFAIKTVGRFPEVGEKIHSGPLTLELVRRVRQKLVLFRLTEKEKPATKTGPAS